MDNSQDNNKRIAKNTLLLYFRMILTMVVSLYTSRVILNELGVEDFGIYNIVAGVVVLFSFISNSMVTSTQRYLSVEIGKDNTDGIQNVFSTSLISHLILVFIILVVAETVGLWFVNSCLDIPEHRMMTTNCVYQLSVITTCFNIIRIPYSASIVANEKMDFYAYISIIEVVLKLLIAWALMVSLGDKLIVYSILLLLVVVLIDIFHFYYCNRKLKSNKFILKIDKLLLKEMTSFSGWNLFGGIADVGYKQGVNILLNIYYGVTVNAALGVSNQVRNAVFSFVTNLQMAANPQIIKSYATCNYAYFESLVFRISKYSYYLMILITIPLIFNIDLILNLWLKNPPLYTSEFVVLSLVFCQIDTLTGPQWVAMQASGKIKKYQVVTSILLLLNLPLSFIFLQLGFSPSSVLYVQILVTLVTLLVRLLFARVFLSISIKSYLKGVVLPIILVTLTSLILPVYVYLHTDGYTRLLLSFISLLYIALCMFVFGTSLNERRLVLEYIKYKVFKR